MKDCNFVWSCQPELNNRMFHILQTNYKLTIDGLSASWTIHDQWSKDAIKTFGNGAFIFHTLAQDFLPIHYPNHPTPAPSLRKFMYVTIHKILNNLNFCCLTPFIYWVNFYFFSFFFFFVCFLDEMTEQSWELLRKKICCFRNDSIPFTTFFYSLLM